MAAIARHITVPSFPMPGAPVLALLQRCQFVASLPPTPVCDTPVELMLEFDQSSHPFRLDLINDGIVVEDGYIYVPDKPGIGVDVNLDILEKYSVK